MLGVTEVKYTKEYPLLNWSEYIQEDLQKVFLRKHIEWEYESEFQIIVADGADTYLKFKAETVTGLIFGRRADAELKRKIVTLLEAASSALHLA